ncbi:hypothetical protein NHJ13051_009158 [Beauveria bassiana]
MLVKREQDTSLSLPSVPRPSHIVAHSVWRARLQQRKVGRAQVVVCTTKPPPPSPGRMDAAGTAATFCSGGQTGGRRRSYNLQPGHGKHAAAAAAHQSTCVAVRLRAAMDDMARFASSSPPAIELVHNMSYRAYKGSAHQFSASESLGKRGRNETHQNLGGGERVVKPPHRLLNVKNELCERAGPHRARGDRFSAPPGPQGLVAKRQMG